MDGWTAPATDAADRLCALVGAVWSVGPPVILDLSRRRVAALLSNPGELERDPPVPVAVPAGLEGAAAAWPGAPSIGDVERSCLGFTEQFVMDVQGIGSAGRRDLSQHLGDRAPGFALAVYTLEYAQRCRMALDRLSPGHPFLAGEAVTVAGSAPADPWTAMDDAMRAIARLTALDPLTSELVRLRGARVHGCRLCQSRLSIDAVDAGGDSATFDAVDADDRSDLDERHKVALRLTDAVITQPTDIAGDLADDIRSCFAPEEAVELVLDVVRNAANKIAVALGADAPNVADGVEYFTVDTTGAVVAGADPGSVRSPTPG